MQFNMHLKNASSILRESLELQINVLTFPNSISN
jgi:hypothetical protein